MQFYITVNSGKEVVCHGVSKRKGIGYCTPVYLHENTPAVLGALECYLENTE